MTNSTRKRGLFITIEGLEGCGKSSNVAFVEQYFSNAGIDLVCTREPGGTPLAEQIRELLLADTPESFDPLTELLLIFAARAQHLSGKIIPALQGGSCVLSDRFTDATFAYQGGGRKLPMGAISKLEKLVQQQLQPDKTLFLDIDVQQGLARAQQRGELDRFEKEDIDFFENVRAAYWERIHQQPDRFVVIDASQPLEAVQRDIARELDAILSASVE